MLGKNFYNNMSTHFSSCIQEEDRSQDTLARAGVNWLNKKNHQIKLNREEKKFRASGGAGQRKGHACRQGGAHREPRNRFPHCASWPISGSRNRQIPLEGMEYIALFGMQTRQERIHSTSISLASCPWAPEAAGWGVTGGDASALVRVPKAWETPWYGFPKSGQF